MADVDQVHELQDAIRVAQKRTGKFEVPDWDLTSQKMVREALLVLGRTIPDFKRTFGTRDEVDPVRHLIGTATAWGGNTMSLSIGSKYGQEDGTL